LLPPPVATTVNATISAVGSGFQAINLGFHSDLLVDSGNTRAPFDSIGLTTGGFPAGTPAGNAGSSLILQSDGAMTILGNGSTFFPLVSPPDSFIFPGGAVFISQTTLNQTVPVLTAYTTSAASWKGVFYEADTLNLFAYTQVNGNSWLNVNKLPSTGVPIAYSLVSLGLNAFGNVLTPSAVHLNAYTTVVGGGPVEFCPGIPPLCP